jgi:copper oxidase (laccase) domain-containing protein
VLTEAGVPRENITVTNLCTKCNPGLFYSYRAMGPKRGIGGCMIEVR